MVKMNKLIFIMVIFVLLFSFGCASDTKEQDYKKCTSVCVSVLEDDFVTMELCREECKKEFLS